MLNEHTRSDKKDENQQKKKTNELTTIKNHNQKKFNFDQQHLEDQYHLEDQHHLEDQQHLVDDHD